MKAAAPGRTFALLAMALFAAILAVWLGIATRPAAGGEIDPRAFWREAQATSDKTKRHAPRFMRRKVRMLRPTRLAHRSTQGRVSSRTAIVPPEIGARGDSVMSSSRVSEAFAMAADVPLRPVPVRSVALTRPPFDGAVIASPRARSAQARAIGDVVSVGFVIAVASIAYVVVSRVVPA